MACSVVKTKESRPNTMEAGSLGGPGVTPFHSKEEADISAVFAGGRCWLRERQKYETSVPWERHRQRGSGSQRPKDVIWWV